jgi:hypothetical protein
MVIDLSLTCMGQALALRFGVQHDLQARLTFLILCIYQSREHE